MQRILVIKLGALGDFILSYRAMTAIRAHHSAAEITLLTIPSLKPLAEAMGLFDRIWYDRRPKFYQLSGWLDLARQLNGGGFERVYDLQTADRTGWYFRLMGQPFARQRPEWSGIVKGCSHPHDRPDRTTKHTLERQLDQLAAAGIDLAEYPSLDMSWVDVDVSRHGLETAGRPYVLFVPGGSAAHPEKRWPVAHYAELASRLVADGMTPVVVGTGSEADLCAKIAAVSAKVVNLCDDSPMLDVMALANGAAGAVGNDTGPMHLIAPMGCPCLVLFSGITAPEMVCPRGPHEGPGSVPPPPGGNPETVTVLCERPLSELSVDRVDVALRAVLRLR